MTQRSLLTSTIIVLAVVGVVAIVAKGLLYVAGVIMGILALSFFIEYMFSKNDRDIAQWQQERLNCITEHLENELRDLQHPTEVQISAVIKRHVRTALFE